MIYAWDNGIEWGNGIEFTGRRQSGGGARAAPRETWWWPVGRLALLPPAGISSDTGRACLPPCCRLYL